MKIIKEDQNLMILRDRVIIGYVVGAVFFLTGIAIIFRPDMLSEETPGWFGFLAVAIGVFIVAMIKTVTVSLDKSLNKLTITQKGLISKNAQEFELDKIKEVEMSVSYDTSGKREGGFSFHLAFVFQDGTIVPLNPGSSSTIRVMGRQIIPEKSLGEKIAGFLGVPFQERRPVTVSETLAAIQAVARESIEKEKEDQNKL